ncbi:dihydrouridine synthase 4-like protein [Astrocystis sublimbata]|nr:dihydrouridine synthase 4-like protein [Astrocystis sublimbata]
MGRHTDQERQTCARTHPLKIFDVAKGRHLVYACAPMVRYSKLAFRQTVHHFGTHLCWSPMILAKEFNRSSYARDFDLTMSTTGPPTIAQFGSNSSLELARASCLVAPFVNGVDLNCGCPQSWACAETLGAALMEKRELVRDMVVATRDRLKEEGWGVGKEADIENLEGKGRSVSVKIRVHKDLRKTVDFINTVLGDEQNRNIDWLTIHPRTRYTQSSVPINLEALELLTDMFGDKLPILVSGDVFTLSALPYTSHLLEQQPTFTSTAYNQDPNGVPASGNTRPHLPKLAGLMSARALLTNPALFAGHATCTWESVDVFMNNVARAPLPLKIGVHHLAEMCGAGFGLDRSSALLSKAERIRLNEMATWLDVIDFMDEIKRAKRNEPLTRLTMDTL